MAIHPLLAAVDSYAPVGVLIVTATALAGIIMLLAHVIGPSRQGPVKSSTYESGMPPVGDARRRFNVRFYLVAMIFLLFDVEVVCFWPWGPLFHRAATTGRPVAWIGTAPIGKGFLLAEMVIFLAILLVGYLYAWRKGVFRWD